MSKKYVLGKSYNSLTGLTIWSYFIAILGCALFSLSVHLIGIGNGWFFFFSLSAMTVAMIFLSPEKSIVSALIQAPIFMRMLGVIGSFWLALDYDLFTERVAWFIVYLIIIKFIYSLIARIFGFEKKYIRKD